MEEPSPKRRRTSPRLSGSPPGNAPELSPQRSPSRSNRPSWASPTRASMARFNPGILERRRSASPPKQPTPSRQARQPSVAGSDANLSEMLFARPQNRAGSGAPVSLPQVDEGQERRGSSPTRPTSRGSIGGAFATAPRRSPVKPSARPLPPPAPEGEGEFDPFARRGIRRSPPTGLGPTHVEPDLPPSVDDPVSSTPPRGIHSSSSPSRRRASKNRTTTGAAGMKSSPLKQPPARPGEETEATGNTQKTLFGNKTSPLKRAVPRPGNENASGNSPRKGSGHATSRPRPAAALAESTNNIRRLPTFDGNLAKKKERDALRAELAKLNKDLEVTSRQNDRIRAMHRTGRMVPLGDEKEVMNILRQYLVPGEAHSAPPESQLLTRAALNPMAIVPFGKPVASAIPSEEDEVDVSKIGSHHPITMTAEEELPFLQLFSPFSATGSVVVLPKLADQPLEQLFTIHLRSRHCPGLFGARLEVTVNSTSLRVHRLRIAALEPAARPELWAFLEKICSGDCNRSMQRNVGVTAWAMAEWLRVAEQRARLWTQLREEFGTKEALIETSANMRTRKSRRGNGNDPEEDRYYETATLQKSKVLEYMGQQSFDIQIPTDGASGLSSLRMRWKIEFDWTGEAKNNIAVMVGVPGKWHAVDSKGALGKIPALFEDLVEGGEESSMAMRKIVALLAHEG